MILLLAAGSGFAKDASPTIDIARAAAYTAALKADGTVWAWGNGAPNNPSLPARHGVPIPVQVQGLSDVTAISAGNGEALALDAMGTVWTWSYGSDAKPSGVQAEDSESGDAPSETPVQVKGLDDVTAVAAGTSYSLALKKDGTVCAWSDATKGKPQQVDGLNHITAIVAGEYTALALKENGAVLSWKYDPKTSAPAEVEGVGQATALAAGAAHFLALQKDGTVRAWGSNACGELGDGTTQASLDPVRVQGLQDVAAIAAGSDRSLALLKDGTVRVWGEHITGGAFSRTPVEMEGLNHVAKISASGGHHVLLGANGAVVDWWAWADDPSVQNTEFLVFSESLDSSKRTEIAPP